MTDAVRTRRSWPPEQVTMLWDHLPARRLQFTLDVLVLAAALICAYCVRFDFDLPPEELSNALIQLPLVVTIQLLAIFWAGIYSLIWRYVGLADLKRFFWAIVPSVVMLVALRLGLPRTMSQWRIPLSVICIDSVLAFGGVLALRLLRRVLFERYERQRCDVPGEARPKGTLLIGAGRAGVLAAREIIGRKDLGMDIRGFIDDDAEKVGAVIHGIKVLGTTEDLPRLVRERGIEQVVITIAQATREQMERIVQVCQAVPVKARIIPGLFEILGGHVEVTRIRDVQIEDLLGREQVHLDAEQLGHAIAGKTIMVTGAGGSIGSELCRQVLRLQPAKLLLVERAEPALFHIDRELRMLNAPVQILPLLADVGDGPRMRGIFEAHRPHLVVHAAAHKHVPLMEENPLETIKNNVFATRQVGELAGEHGAEGFILVSTDKAVRPTSMMGASKRVAELIVQELNLRFATRYLAVRFGNVLGSNGSLIPILREQIQKGGPVTITHPDMKRYFMTIPEASQLILQAGAMGLGGEIFVLDMGEPVRIVDLAERMITLSGLRRHQDIDIVFTGLRPGEKLFEELATDAENAQKTRHPKIFIGRIAPYPPEVIARGLEEIAYACRSNDPTLLRYRLAQLLPEASLSGVPASLPASAAAADRHGRGANGVSRPEKAVSDVAVPG